MRCTENWQNPTPIKAEIYKLKSEPSNYLSKEEKAWIISLNRFKLDTKAKAVQLVEMSSSNVLKTFKTQTDCADFFNIPETAILRFAPSVEEKVKKKKINSIWI